MSSYAFLPISTTAVDGREIVFQDQPVVYSGQDALFRSRKKVKIAAGTAFAAYTANYFLSLSLFGMFSVSCCCYISARYRLFCKKVLNYLVSC
jgi:hypothetical protein